MKHTMIGIVIGFVAACVAMDKITDWGQTVPNKGTESPVEVMATFDESSVKSQGQLEDESRAEFERFLDAIEWVESKGDANSMGDFQSIPCPEGRLGCLVYHGEYQAIGAYQLTEAYVDDVDSRFRESYGMSVFDYSDRYDKEKSRSMVILYFLFVKKLPQDP